VEDLGHLALEAENLRAERMREGEGSSVKRESLPSCRARVVPGVAYDGAPQRAEMDADLMFVPRVELHFDERTTGAAVENAIMRASLLGSGVTFCDSHIEAAEVFEQRKLDGTRWRGGAALYHCDVGFLRLRPGCHELVARETGAGDEQYPRGLAVKPMHRMGVPALAAAAKLSFE
jgi:hypothetical protein